MELARCKHCGGEATVQEETNIIQNYYGFSCWYVKCLSCGIRTGYGKKQEVIDCWNKNPPIKNNYDLIKLLPLGEFAKFLTEPHCDLRTPLECLNYVSCTKCIEDWLMEEHNND